jgi:hypothetical protein
VNRPVRPSDLFDNADAVNLARASGNEAFAQLSLGIAHLHLEMAKRALGVAELLMPGKQRMLSRAHEGLTRSMMIVEGLAPQLSELAQDEEEWV